MADRQLMDTEASVIATFDFLSSDNVDDDEDENLRFVCSLHCLCLVGGLPLLILDCTSSSVLMA